MKKSLLLFTAAFMLFSCTKEDVPENTYTKSDLLGVWELKSVTSKYGENEVSNECDLQSKIEFFESTIEEDWYIYIGENNCRHLEIEYLYSLEGKNLILTSDIQSDSLFFSGTIKSSTEIDITKKSGETKAIYTYIKF